MNENTQNLIATTAFAAAGAALLSLTLIANNIAVKEAESIRLAPPMSTPLP
ncbi:hypothetical protein [Tateyamaria sp.]|uniref:hypothetical protein n=1 Tax=Tateyamaria sp. TaxID=1929288 RepID=UPI00329D2174